MNHYLKQTQLKANLKSCFLPTLKKFVKLKNIIIKLQLKNMKSSMILNKDSAVVKSLKFGSLPWIRC